MAMIEMTGVAYEPINIDFTRDRPLLNTVNPLGRVPVLKSDGLSISDTIAICLWLNAKHPATDLLPEEADSFAMTASQMAWLGTELHIRRRRFARPLAFASDAQAQSSVRDAGRQSYRDGLDILGRWIQRSSVETPRGLSAYFLLFQYWAVADGLWNREAVQDTPFYRRLTCLPGISRALELHDSPLI